MIKFHRQFDTRGVKLLIFDLDGTLIDSRLDLIHSVNAMLRHFKRSELPGEVIASYVGDGAPMLVRRALGDPKDEHFAKSALEFFPAKKPDPLGARTLLEQTRTRPEEALIVGDSSIDVITGRNAGVWTCGVTYGFAPHTLCEAPPDVVVDKPQELAKLFG